MTAAAPPLAPDLTEGLRRLKLAAMRQLAPELLLTAKTQRWTPEELLRTLVEAEISARDASNARARLRNAAFPVTKTLEELDLGVSTVPQATVAYLASLEWITAAENLCLVGPAVIRRLNFSAACFPRSGRCCDRCDDVRWLRAARSSRAGSVRAGVPGSRRGLARGLPAVRGLPGGVVS
jgi:hypothetical protein